MSEDVTCILTRCANKHRQRGQWVVFVFKPVRRDICAKICFEMFHMDFVTDIKVHFSFLQSNFARQIQKHV